MAPRPKNKSIDKREYEVVLTLLRAIRVKANLTQQALGEAMGRDQAFVSACEVGSRRLDPLQVHTWCAACGTTYQDFGRRVDEALELFPKMLAVKPKPRHKK
ncbi:helix-turn-helix domain-containing protein [Dyella humi]|uniref:helix-turn-helix domain-containing protein n=1 Tax=Dyella humi TaxID=1770547 RepID=UPI003608DC10